MRQLQRILQILSELKPGTPKMTDILDHMPTTISLLQTELIHQMVTKPSVIQHHAYGTSCRHLSACLQILIFLRKNLRPISFQSNLLRWLAILYFVFCLRLCTL